MYVFNGDQCDDSGGRYRESTDTWEAMGTAGSPGGRYGAGVVQTSLGPFQYGGVNCINGLPTSGGFYYDHPTLKWNGASSNGSPPTARSGMAIAYDGSDKVFIWGGEVSFPVSFYLASGAVYSFGSDSWTATSASPLNARIGHVAIYDGTDFIVWGGDNQGLSFTNTGAKYDPVGDTWTSTTTTGAPTGRQNALGFWSGSEMIIYGGRNHLGFGLTSGARYKPGPDTWTAMPDGAAFASNIREPKGVWTGTRLIFWSGEMTGNVGDRANFGAAYRPPY
jgi:hypothetical protein